MDTILKGEGTIDILNTQEESFILEDMRVREHGKRTTGFEHRRAFDLASRRINPMR
jgi:hypothetical protein